ncbi:glucose 1-dehydrogenase [Sphingobium sp. CR2-8]|uniref:SDR family NAD(P)-dependent oxidoreductase n=1 Tax=Sphingobium sp. CR2-8 TaxID=1306534 RepID=UPI002DBD4D5C|nr:glucose 1-dehydrogenase [Sphingobium sp. CR2-8]MEC3911890.1 glucose 1-dehydrogenase [Sphingobium sp. CR2-8]
MTGGNFSDKVAIVTGAGRGMGEAVVRRLVAEGARVCLADIDEAALLNVVADLPADRVMPLQVDVADVVAVTSMVEAAAARWGRLDMLHNNAGITGLSGPALQSSLADLEQVFAVNFRATFVAIKAAVPHMQLQGGSIVNMSSLFGIRAAPGMGLYGASKAAVIGLTKTLSVELAPRIRVNSVAPGAIDTELLRSSNKALHVPGGPSYADKLKTMPMQRAGTPEEAANLITWLLGDEASFVSGAVYQIDGARGA